MGSSIFVFFWFWFLCFWLKTPMGLCMYIYIYINNVYIMYVFVLCHLLGSQQCITAKTKYNNNGSNTYEKTHGPKTMHNIQKLFLQTYMPKFY